MFVLIVPDSEIGGRGGGVGGEKHLKDDRQMETIPLFLVLLRAVSSNCSVLDVALDKRGTWYYPRHCCMVQVSILWYTFKSLVHS